MRSFYGNITNTSQTHFQFDRVFHNRHEMDSGASTDNVLIGRFVLVQYDWDGGLTENHILTGFKKNNDNKIYVDKNYEHPYLFATFNSVGRQSNYNSLLFRQHTSYKADGTIASTFYIHVSEQEFDSNEQNYAKPINISEAQINYIVGINALVHLRDLNGNYLDEYYICRNGISGQAAVWEKIILSSSSPYNYYFQNYLVDKAFYKNVDTISIGAKGYDATVWQKVYGSGTGRYRLIAELNSSMPILELIADAPSESPTVAYIDALSSDKVYRIHTPTRYGFQLKEATNLDLSDQTAIINKVNYNTTTKEYTFTPKEIQADIFLNLKDDHSKIDLHNSTIKNEILLLPEGKSGKKYYDKNGNIIENDIMELSIHLPAVGNMIADGYNLIYGTNGVGENRPRDVNWYNANDARRETGDSSLGGKNFQLNTLAGTLNEMHRKLGQIIITLPTRPAIDSLSNYNENCIYYIQDEDKFYRVGKTFRFEDLDTNENLIFDMVQDDNIKNNRFLYEDQTFYVKNPNNPNEYMVANGWDSSTDYYKKAVKTSKAYTPIDLEKYQPGEFFYQIGLNYICDRNTLPSALGQTYYKKINPAEGHIVKTNDATITTNGKYITTIPGTFFHDEYVANTWFYYDETTGNYVKDPEIMPSPDRRYYSFMITSESSNMYYFPNYYYYKEDNIFKSCSPYPTINSLLNNTSVTLSDNLYWFEFNEDEENIIIYEQDGQQHIVLAHPLLEDEAGIHQTTRALRFLANLPNNANNLYVLNEDQTKYINYENLLNEITVTDGTATPLFTQPIVFTRLNNIIDITDKLYIRNKFYYEDQIENSMERGSFKIASSGLNINMNYYLINNPPRVEKEFYVPGKYYYETSPGYIEIMYDTYRTYTSGYYIQTPLYVAADTSGRCPIGLEWSMASTYVPASITLKKRIEYNDWIPIDGFYNGQQTINGFLLELNKQFNWENQGMRDKTSFSGMLNLLNDYLYFIRKRIPNQLVSINNFGQFTASGINYITIKQLSDLLERKDGSKTYLEKLEELLTD